MGASRARGGAWRVAGHSRVRMRAGPGRRQRGEAGGRRGGGGAGHGAGTARLQRTGLRHGLHERLEALDAVLELEAREADAVEPRLVRVRVSSPYALALALALTRTWQ